LKKLTAVSFEQITRVLQLTDQLGISRELVEIPLSPSSPGTVQKLANGKLEIVVDSEVPFDEWLSLLEGKIKAVLQS
jgi:hypothetical protein